MIERHGSQSTTSIKVACDGLEDLVTQLLKRDGPNDARVVTVPEPGTKKGASGSTMASAPSLSLSTSTCTSSTSSSSLPVSSSVPRDSAIHPHSDMLSYTNPPAAIRLGHASLVELTRRTLREIQRPPPPDGQRVTESQKAVFRAGTDTTTATSTSATTSPRLLVSMPSNNHSSDTTVARDSSKQDEEKRQERPCVQLYGSEFARYIEPSVVSQPHSSSTTGRQGLLRRSDSSATTTTKLTTTSNTDIPIIQEADPAVRSGALLDICVTRGKQLPPRGFYRLAQTTSGIPFSLPKTNKDPKRTMYLNVKKEPIWDKAAQRPCITALCIIFPDRKEFVPPGFSIVRVSGSTEPANLSVTSDQSQKQGAERIFLCYRRSREGNPITDIVPLMPRQNEAIPTGYTVIERTPRNHVATLSCATTTKHPLTKRTTKVSSLALTEAPIFLAYRQRLANLECLRPLPLLLALQQQQQQQQQYTESSYSSSSRLSCYYSTGATVVSSSIGRFHVLDRSTHSLLSPSSVENRLKLIQESQQKSLPAQQSDSSCVEEDLPLMRFDDLSSIADSVQSRRNYYHNTSDPSRFDQMSLCSSKIGEESTYEVNPSSFSSLLIVARDRKQRFVPLFASAGGILDYILEAMDFIPTPDVALKGELKHDAEDRLTTRAAILVPMLTACYNRHGGSALLAVEYLTKLLTETNFFKDDVDTNDDSGDNESSTRLTLLDLSVQVVCDVASTGVEETTFGACVEFVETSIRYSEAQLNTRSIGYIGRFYMFVFYFGASIPARSLTRWRPNNLRGTTASDDNDFALLIDPRREHTSYLPGGAPQSAALAFKELISLSITRLGKVSVSDMIVMSVLEKTHSNEKRLIGLQDPYQDLIDSIIGSIVNDSVDHVERANISQLVLHQVLRSGGSELFWHDMVNTCGKGLFGKDQKMGESGRDVFIITFAILASLVKVASGKLSPALQSREMLPKDLASKILSLELLLHFLEFWSDEHEAVSVVSSEARRRASVDSFETLSYIIRRTVAPCLLWNTRAAIDNVQVFRRVIKIITELWCSPVHRQVCKIELGILIEHFALATIAVRPNHFKSSRQSKASTLYPIQLSMMQEVKSWFTADPKFVLELYLNYDTDIATEIAGPTQLLPGTQWKLFQRISSSLCDASEVCAQVLSKDLIHRNLIADASQDKWRQLSWFFDDVDSRPTSEISDLDSTRAQAGNLRKASLETLAQIAKSLAILAASTTGSRMLEFVASWDPMFADGQHLPESNICSLSREVRNESICHESSRLSMYAGADTVVLFERSEKDTGDEVLRFWREAINERHQHKFSNVTAPVEDTLSTAFELASGTNIKKAIEYLIACDLLTPSPRDISNFLRINKSRLDRADLGIYLSEGGHFQADKDHCNSVRYLYIRSMSFVGMSIEKALRHFVASSGFHFPGEAQRIDRLINTFSRCYFEDNAGCHEFCPFSDQDTVFIVVFAMIMLNTDLHKATHRSRASKKMTKAEFVINVKGVVGDRGENVTEFLNSIYDSVADCPITLNDEKSSNLPSSDDESTMDYMLRNVRSADSLLRGLAVHDYKFATISDYAETFDCHYNHALCDLTKSCVLKTWHHWHCAINTSIELDQVDPESMEPSIELLLFALVVTTCLKLPMERSAFLLQLGRLRELSSKTSEIDRSPLVDYREQPWFKDLCTSLNGSLDSKISALSTIRQWSQAAFSSAALKIQRKVQLMNVVAEIKNGNYLLDVPDRYYIRHGDLVKKSSRTGKLSKYKFFLFSDLLLYGSLESGNHCKIHEELSLHSMKIIDWFPTSQRSRSVMFEIVHPRKTFQVICATEDERKSWVLSVRKAIHHFITINAQLMDN